MKNDKISEKEKTKTDKEIKKNLEKILKKDKFSKNVISARKSVIKTTLKKEKNNEKILKKCDNYTLKIAKNKQTEKDIILKINEFNNNDKKTLVYFIDSFYPSIDGVLSVMENYVKFMQQYYNVVVCAPKHNRKCYGGDDYFVLYSDSIYMKKQGYDCAFPDLDFEFQKYISLLKIDLIHLESPFNLGNFGLNLGKKRKVPVFITFHSQFKRNFYDVVKNDTIATWLTKIVIQTFNKADVVMTMNPFARDILKGYGCKNKIEIIPNATNLIKKEFTNEQEKEIIEKHKININKFNMVFLGRFVAVKNIYFLIDTINELSKINRDFNFVFMGYGPELEKMKKTCSNYGLDDIVKFTGKIDDEDEKAIILKNCDLMFFPSFYEIDSIVKIEAACYDVPVLCLENTTLSSVITNDKNGFICKNDMNECVKKLDYLIKNVEIVKKVGKNANLDLYFNWDKPCSETRELYEKYLNAKNFKKSKKNKNNSTENI